MGKKERGKRNRSTNCSAVRKKGECRFEREKIAPLCAVQIERRVEDAVQVGARDPSQMQGKEEKKSENKERRQKNEDKGKASKWVKRMYVEAQAERKKTFQQEDG